MYYMKNRLNMKWLAVIFAIATIISSFGTGNLPQVNSIANAMHSTFGINHMLTGGILALLLGIVIIGGIKRIAKVTETLVPIMALVYIIGSFLVILYNYENIIPSIQLISSSIFTGTAAVGGFLGASIAFARVPAGTGAACQVDIRGKLLNARVVQPPFARNGKACIEI